MTVHRRNRLPGVFGRRRPMQYPETVTGRRRRALESERGRYKNGDCSGPWPPRYKTPGDCVLIFFIYVSLSHMHNTFRTDAKLIILLER